MPFLGPNSEIPEKGKGSYLTERQIRFCDEFMVDFNASQAVKRAGYRTKNPNRIGTELLRHPLVQKEIQKRQQAQRERLELSADYVITKLMSIAEATEEEKPLAALRALELLGKHLGLYRERTEVSGPDGNAIEINKRMEEDVASLTSAITRLIDRGRTPEVVGVPNTGTTG